MELLQAFRSVDLNDVDGAEQLLKNADIYLRKSRPDAPTVRSDEVLEVISISWR